MEVTGFLTSVAASQTAGTSALAVPCEVPIHRTLSRPQLGASPPLLHGVIGYTYIPSSTFWTKSPQTPYVAGAGDVEGLPRLQGAAARSSGDLICTGTEELGERTSVEVALANLSPDDTFERLRRVR